jgi:hypothetical protein
MAVIFEREELYRLTLEVSAVGTQQDMVDLQSALAKFLADYRGDRPLAGKWVSDSRIAKER